MKQFLIIGLGNFGSSIAKALYERGCQVLAIDTDKEKIQDIKDFVSQSMILEARDKDAVKSLPIEDTDTRGNKFGRSDGSHYFSYVVS